MVDCSVPVAMKARDDLQDVGMNFTADVLQEADALLDRAKRFTERVKILVVVMKVDLDREREHEFVDEGYVGHE